MRCSEIDCSNKAVYLCKSCTKFCGFCNLHAQIHVRNFNHGIFDAIGKSFHHAESESFKLMMTMNSWYFDSDLGTNDLILQNIWLLCTLSRPTTFFHHEMLIAASNLIIICNLSFENIVLFFEKQYMLLTPLSGGKIIFLIRY